MRENWTRNLGIQEQLRPLRITQSSNLLEVQTNKLGRVSNVCNFSSRRNKRRINSISGCLSVLILSILSHSKSWTLQIRCLKGKNLRRLYRIAENKSMNSVKIAFPKSMKNFPVTSLNRRNLKIIRLLIR